MRKIIPALLVCAVLCGCHKENTTNKNITNKSTNSTFTIPADSVFLNPTGNAPLSAIVRFRSSISGHAAIVVKGMHGTLSDIDQSYTDSGTYHSIPILGLYAGYKNTVDIYVIDAKGDSSKAEINITTGTLPANMPNYIHADIANLGSMEPGLNLVSNFSQYSGTPLVPFILDSFGDIRWCLDFTNNPTLNHLFYDCGINRLQNGNFRFVDGSTEKIYEVDIMGKIINIWGLGGYTFHHDLYEKPNGNFLMTANLPGSTHTDGTPTDEDYVIEIDRNSDAILNVWDLKQSLNEYRQTLNNDPTDWIHENGVVYDATDNTIVLSGRVQGVVKLTYDNQVKWILGNHRGWGTNRRGQDLNQYLLTPIDSTGQKVTDTAVLNGWVNAPGFEWNWYQHSPQLMPNGDILMFDNGQTRNFNPNASVHYSRAVEYKIDETNMTVTQIWEYGKERGQETFSSIVSSVKYLPGTNHILFSPGFQVPNASGSGGKIVEVDYATKNVVFQASVSAANGWGFHRVQRMPLYPNANAYK